MNKVDLLTQMQKFGGLHHRQSFALAILDQLRECLPDNEYMEVEAAWKLYNGGCGDQELYAVCNRLINKYRGGPPPRKSLICA